MLWDDRLSVAARDQMKTPSRSLDRESGTQPGTQATPIAHVLALQRTLGNRATSGLLLSRRPPEALLQRVLRGREDIVSGRNNHQLTEAEGRQLLEEFARNDPRSVGALVNAPFGMAPNQNTRGDWMLDDQEWGLIREDATGEMHLIEGGKHGVNFDAYRNESTPLAHSHPFQYGKRSITMGSIDFATLLTQQDQAAKQARTMVLPSISDFVYPAERQQQLHTVYTPYVVDANTGDVRNPTPQDAGAPRLIWRLSQIVLDQANHRVEGRLTALSGGHAVWSRRVRADSNNRRGTDYMIIGA